uniref:ATP-dependent Clp protease proteolytic subunit n=1 Tax=Sophora prazeri TaxID=1323966 RepID=A0A8K1RFY1_9FABA|nr:clp protease proteolytic subunit [Sophora prazeri]
MPIGVPKVPFRIPGEEDASWVDILINRLYRERLLFLGQEVDSEISNQLIGLMVYLSIEDDNQDLYLFINSPGGWVIPGIAIYDTMQFVQPDVQTVCMGLAASMGSFILAGGEITKRLAFPHAQGNDPSTRLFFLLGTNGRIYPGSGRTIEIARNYHKGLCTKNGQTFMACIRRHGKRCFYVGNRSPSSRNCWSCSG